MAKTGKPQTYNDVIAALTEHSAILPTNLLEKIDAAIKANRQLSITTREGFVEDAVKAMLQKLNHNKRIINH